MNIATPLKNYMKNHREWSATCDQDWCQAIPTTGKGDNLQFSLTVSENTTG